MHLIPQTFYTLHFNERDAAEIVQAANAVMRDFDVPFHEFPVLDNLFGALAGVSGTNIFESYEQNEQPMIEFTPEPEDPDAPEEAYD